MSTLGSIFCVVAILGATMTGAWLVAVVRANLRLPPEVFDYDQDYLY